MSGIRITGPWTREQTAQWLDDEVGNKTVLQIVVLFCTTLTLTVIRIAVGGAGAIMVGTMAVMAVVVGLLGIALAVIATDYHAAIPVIKPGTLRLHKIVSWSIGTAGIVVGIWHVHPIPPLVAGTLLVACNKLLPRPWWRGVDRTPPSPVDELPELGFGVTSDEVYPVEFDTTKRDRR